MEWAVSGREQENVTTLVHGLEVMTVLEIILAILSVMEVSAVQVFFHLIIFSILIFIKSLDASNQLGCYEFTGGVTQVVARAPGDKMTSCWCVGYCIFRGYSLAGVRNGFV